MEQLLRSLFIIDLLRWLIFELMGFNVIIQDYFTNELLPAFIAPTNNETKELLLFYLNLGVH